jgi:hypothetical protein
MGKEEIQHITCTTAAKKRTDIITHLDGRVYYLEEE